MGIPASRPPSVLFVCVKNGGKSQMAAGLMRHLAGDSVTVGSAGTQVGISLNDLSVQSLVELGIDITNQAPKALNDDLIRDADLIVVLGTDAQVDPIDKTPVETWVIDEPSERGINGIERMRLVRDDIAARVEALRTRDA